MNRGGPRGQDVAAVDLGSNSFHMMVARPHGSDLQVIDRLREPVRLAAGLDPERRLRPEAEARALACLQRFGQRLKQIPPARVRAVGTNTLRKLRRGEAFLAAAEAALGHEIEIISGVEEARLVYGGVIHGMGPDRPRRLVVDIGGGSTELIIGRGPEPKMMESVALGCVTHQQKFFADGEITRARFRAARMAARVELEFLERRYRKAGWDLAIGASGTVRGAWRVMLELGYSEQDLTREGLERLIERVIELGQVARIEFPSLREDRRPVFPGGLAVLAGVFDSLGIERMETSERALREGLVYDLLGRLADQDVRDQTVAAVARRFGLDSAHAGVVAETAVQLLTAAREGWDLTEPACESLLRWAAQLHELGLVIAHSGYHKHGEYILRHADLQGFSLTEQKLLAVLVRLHRGKFSPAVAADLPPAWQESIQRLAVLLRVAVLLQRSRQPQGRIPVSLKVARRSLDLSFPADWRAEHPLTVADLELEAEYLRAVEIRLRVG
ncbi:MAG TPA: Ppx/GppA phosphatase family protein [Nevskiaceae bacterium]|nr:Ppx/GppA phosphatase family protein [Nevskiaceae bacterium]